MKMGPAWLVTDKRIPIDGRSVETSHDESGHARSRVGKCTFIPEM